jgi:ribA/ribD-fused uncharacterized protein
MEDIIFIYKISILLIMRYNLKWLIEKYNAGENLEYCFFWGHQPSKDGSIQKTCFSQWWAGHSFEVDGQVYPTAEHWMMAGKARLFLDEEMLELILKAGTPLEAKKLGRKVRNFDQAIWKAHRFEIVKTGNIHKFSQHEDLKAFLLNTNNQIIVEASPRDRIWGIGMGAKNEKALHPPQWRGQNLLGFVLMAVRGELL